ncbi:unnamed protein product [Mytilus coruscus]|uniref:Uncharacterized protein n=1 Tax=Mytilus coruscus TaxID=42192 RepID=A0A6J8BVV7_MYTCO|nr:unnamed protein product [Mytilus coruscus]
MSLERNEFRVGSDSDEGEPKEERTTEMVQRAENYEENTEITKELSKTYNTKGSKATMSLERNEFKVGSDSDEGEPKEERTTAMVQRAEDYVETTENTKDMSKTNNTKESKATMSLERNEFRVGSDSDEGEPKERKKNRNGPTCRRLCRNYGKYKRSVSNV